MPAHYARRRRQSSGGAPFKPRKKSTLNRVEFVRYDAPFSEYRYRGREYVYNPEYGSWVDTTNDTLVKDKKTLDALFAALHKSYIGPDNPPFF
jgi:hypothetical protein